MQWRTRIGGCLLSIAFIAAGCTEAATNKGAEADAAAQDDAADGTTADSAVDANAQTDAADGFAADGSVGDAQTDAPLLGEECENDPVTGASLDAAREQLAAGELSVAFSPGGCVRYDRTLNGSDVATERLTYNGNLSLSYDRSEAGVTGQGDFDLDGFFEWSYSFVRGQTEEEDQVVMTDYQPATQDISQRKTYTHTGDQIHVVIERPNAEAALEVVREFDTSRFQDGEGVPPNRTLTSSGCSATDGALITQRLREAMDGDPADPKSGGLVCLFSKGAKDKVARLLAAYAGHDVVVVCDSTISGAYYDGADWFGLGDIHVHVNPTDFGKLSPHEQRHLLFHEMLHELGEHDLELKKAPRVRIDPTEACAEMCWPTPLTTKCSCATCLGTNICDPRCASFKSCDPDMGAQCPCPTSGEYYDSCSACLVGCPSGLICAFYSTCIPLSVACTAVTCP